ncbi:SiaB family protein kinase [Cytophagales bacterium LB-30]|uniref:SiaB family protein kinase n=1 Tax=Shiella aurantiaca TaxID=3058365 RepID=A0ABT8F132_9BACT|nr:SiaB family protein kinase [Shiella aurantiaca]MDN4164152.1 SiaB family protein kinase [Shiella aurantiaca]
MLDIHDYYHKMQNKDIVLAYKGNVSGDLFNCILQLAENKLDKIELSPKLKKKVFNILVEILQNIYHHFDEIQVDSEEYQTILFMLTREGEGGYNIVTGNHVAADKVAGLKKRIDDINAMSTEELKSVYRERLNNGDVSEKGGAGLGIIDIVRKSGDKLVYDFKSVNTNYSFFSLQVRVSA